MPVNIIREILSITEDAESPRSWIMWSAMTAISAVIGRQVWLNMGGVYTIYPNLYVMLVGDSGLRKSLPTDIIHTLVEGVGNTRLITGRNTIQAMISSLSQAYTTEKGEIIKEGRAAIISEEFGVLLIEDKHSDLVLTTWYDTGKDHWYNITKNSGREVIYKPYITIFGASNQTNLRLALSKASITGGLIGRFIFVEEFKRHKHNPLTKPAPPIDYSRAIDALKEISKLEGQFSFSPDGEEVFIKFYEDLGKSMDNGGDPTGTLNRIHVKVLKVAMIIAMSEGHGLILHKDDIEKAIQACITYSGTKIWSGVGISEDSTKIAMLMETLRKSPEGELGYAELLRRHFQDFSAQDLNRMIETLTTSGLVEVGRKGEKGVMRITKIGWEFLDSLTKKEEKEEEVS